MNILSIFSMGKFQDKGMTIGDIEIRETRSTDFNDIMLVVELAFGQKEEANLVADLLKDKSAEPIISLLAFSNKKAIGHILFTRVYIDNAINQPLFHILAPLAVIPEFQKKGTGGLLIKAGLEILKERGSKLVFVLGHMEYYPRFGFIPDAKKLGFQAPYQIPEEHANAWMVQSLSNNALEIFKGDVRCSDELNKPEYWRE